MGVSPAPIGPAQPSGRLHEVVTPEGVPLRLEVALAGDRLGALIIDLVFMAVVVVGVPLGLALSGAPLAGDAFGALVILLLFLVWTFYFPAFELAWQGQTPGKRLVKIRAVDARGGPLTAEAVIARNLSKQFELLLPMMALFSLRASGWFDLAAVGWMAALGFLPLFNKDRMRVGDMIAGTIVIRVPSTVLLEDLTTHRAATSHAFTEAQLDIYGVYELQVLEGVLRGSSAPGHAEAVRTVADKIRQKIGWTGPVTSDEAFLQAFYAALRARLEKRLLFGKRRRSKHDRT
jgi:uncharacterized RDD family membrane protein YckC